MAVCLMLTCMVSSFVCVCVGGRGKGEGEGGGGRGEGGGGGEEGEEGRGERVETSRHISRSWSRRSLLSEIEL